jgi:hypothetical protein
LKAIDHIRRLQLALQSALQSELKFKIAVSKLSLPGIAKK